MEKNLLDINSTLRQTSSIGNQVTNGFNQGIKNLTGGINSLIFQYVSFQAVTSGYSRSVQKKGSEKGSSVGYYGSNLLVK